MTDDYLVQLLRLLDDEPSKPTRVDLARAIAEARRRRRTRRLVGVGGAAALTVVLVAAVPATFQAVRPDPAITDPPGRSAAAAATMSPGAGSSANPFGKADPATTVDPVASPASARPTPPTGCAIERLPIPGRHPMSLVTGADPSGRFILGRSYPAASKGSYPVLIWDHGTAIQVDVPGADQALTDATSTGVAVGTGWAEQGPLPYLVRNGKATRLPSPGTAQARAINEAGRIAGTRDDRHPVVWPSADSDPVDLRLPGPEWRGEAADIDEDGTVVGVVSDDGGQTEHAQVWFADGTGRLLPTPVVDGRPAASFRPQTIRNGWVTGVAGSGAGSGSGSGAGAGEKGNVPVRLHLASGTFVDFPRNQVWPQHGNGHGWVVGSTPQGSAALLTDRGLLTLPELDNRRTSTANFAWRLSDDGRTVVGQSDNAKGDPQAVRWRCR